MPRKKVARTRSNYLENTTDGVGLIAELQPIANVAYPSSSSSKFMLQRKRSVNVNHLHSYHTQGIALGLAEMCTDSNQTNYYSSDSSIDQNLYPASFSEKATDSKLLDISMSGVRSAERSMESNILHSYHSDPSASQSMSVRSAERSIDSNVLQHSYHSDRSAFKLMSVRSAEKSIESNDLQNAEGLDLKIWTQVTSSDQSMSNVRPAERSIELSQLYSYHFHPPASNLPPECLRKGSTDSKVIEYNYSVQTGNFDLSISDIRSAERSLVLVLN